MLLIKSAKKIIIILSLFFSFLLFAIFIGGFITVEDFVAGLVVYAAGLYWIGCFLLKKPMYIFNIVTPLLESNPDHYPFRVLIASLAGVLCIANTFGLISVLL